MMKKVVVLSIVIMLFGSRGFTQIQLTQYFLDETLYNPAFAGANDAICANSYIRDQWIGLTDVNGNKVSPVSGTFNLHAPLYNLNSGIGMNVIYDKAGFEQDLGIKMNYSYFMPLNNDNSKFGLGLGVSLLNKSIDFSQFILQQPNDPVFQTTQKESGIIPDIDFGIQYQDYKKMSFGISVNHALESSANIGSIRYAQKRSFYLTGSYFVKLLDERYNILYLVPSFLIKSNVKNFQADINARVEYKNMYWVGVSWRYQDAAAVLAGFSVKGFRIGASYDLTTSYLSRATRGSVEFFVGYCHTIGPKFKKNCNYNTRYL